MPVGILKLHLYLPLVHSLKEKCHLLKPMIHALQSRYLVSIAETGKQDVWQNTEILIAIASSDSAEIEGITERLLTFLETYTAEVYITENELEIIFE